MAPQKMKPSWAHEENLKRLILLPALRQVYIVTAFYSEGKSTIELAAEMGTTKHAIRTLLMRVRRALGVTRDHSDIVTVKIGLHLPGEKHNEFARGFEVHGRRRLLRSKGRHYHPVIDDERLQDLLVGPSLKRYQIAVSFWVHGLTRRQIADRLGVTWGTIDSQLKLVRRRAENPQLAPRVPTGMRLAKRLQV